MISIRRWQARHLFMAWGLYWVGLLAVVASRPLLEYWRLKRSSGHGTVSYTFDGEMLGPSLWIAGPPLVLFLIWLATRSRAPETPRATERVNG
jgi:hypothetical protein